MSRPPPRRDSDEDLLLLRRVNNALRREGRRIRSRAPANCASFGRYFVVNVATGIVLEQTVDLDAVAATFGVARQRGQKRRSPYRAPTALVQQRELVARDVGVAAALEALVQIRAHVDQPAVGWLRLVELSHAHGWSSSACRSYVETVVAAATGRPA